jgi:serine/threonine-protein phosphatase CPPED1
MSKKYWGLILVLLLIYGLISYYHLITVDNQDSNWNYHELQKISTNESNFSFAVYGDDGNSGGRFEHLIKSLNGKDVLFSLDNGDLTTSGTAREFGYFLIELTQLKAPVLTNIGNHDLFNHNNESNYINMFGNSYYSFTEKNSYFIVIDDAKSNINDTQMSWLKNELKKSQNYKYRFVFMHIPLYDPRYGATGEGLSLNNSTTVKTLNGLFDEYNVTMIFASHIHGYFRGVWGKTPFITTGGAGYPLSKPPAKYNDSNSTENYFYHYILVNVTDRGVNYDVVKYN